MTTKKIDGIKKLKNMMTMYYLNAKNAAHNNQKVGWISSGGPVELLIAFDIIPIYPENYAAMCGATKMGGGLAQVAEDKGYSPDLCSYFRIDVGQAETQGGPLMGLPAPDFFIGSNNICGTITKWYEVQSRKFNVPNIHVDAPFIYGGVDQSAIRYIAQQFKEMVPVLEQVTGKKFDEEKFFQVLLQSQEACAYWADILDCCEAKPAPMSSFDTFFLMAPIVTLRGTPECTAFYKDLRDEMRQRVADGISAIENEKYRLMWDNIPIWFATKAVAEEFTKQGAVFVSATYTASWTLDKKFDEGDPWEAMAENYLAPYINRGFDTRVDILSDLMNKFSADGIVFHSARSCKSYSLGMYDLREAVTEKTGKPGLVIEGDIADERMYSEAQVETRIGAFMETLHAAKGN